MRLSRTFLAIFRKLGLAKLAYKAEEAGRQLVKVDPRGTSQRCPCGARVPKKLSDREHVCTACGLIGKRDHVSAMEILRLGLSISMALTWSRLRSEEHTSELQSRVDLV